MSIYIRKTRDEFVILANYGYGHGWEEETTEDTYQEGKQRLQEYRENTPAGHYKLIKRRVKR